MIIEELAKKNVNIIPNSELVKYYEAAIPQYCMELVLTMQKEKELSILQEFILKFVVENINDIESICIFLGISKRAVYNAIAEMQAIELVTVDVFNSKIKITNKGRKALEEAMLIIPEDIEYKVFMDALIGNVYLDTKKKYKKKELREFELTPVATYIDKPDINDISFEDLKVAINRFKKENFDQKDKLEGNLISISSMEKVYAEYNKVSVLVYMNRNTQDIELRVYEKHTRRPEYENILLQMYNNNMHIFEFDKKNSFDENKSESLLNSLPKEFIQSAKEFTKKSSEIEREILELQTQLTTIKELSEDNELEGGKLLANKRIRILEQKIQEMEEERKSADRILSTYDHRPLLIQAFKEAKNTIIIISPWIKSSGLNNEILALIEEAVKRKVRVIIGYGISKKEDSDRWIIKKLNNIKNKNGGMNLELIALNNTHEKILIMDDKFMVITSFNWLSFKGDPRQGFRQETGYYTESKKCILDMKKNLSQKHRLDTVLK
ncbi:phospholipase D-like domain-containing protein [Clostridium perfringens]|uniref:phospholipase D-like domain-containing protein n=1 Tax=Clostridium perfringens TaxID=1502 RepID=UPI002248397D|nr:phospholipase D-like domain-containing protein [Clostridium perfringens]MCX0404945.1 phospholipase D-like domain-containing protein [Clostridium perfringens]